MMDIRDCFFQGDPFSIIPTEGSNFYVFKGVEHVTIENDGWNGGWVSEEYFLFLFKNRGISLNTVFILIIFSLA